MKYDLLLRRAFLCLGLTLASAHAEILVPKLPQPGPNDGRIAYVVARMLEQDHYRQQKFDDAVSAQFFDGYFEMLDSQRLHFLASDVADFAAVRTNLDNLTLSDERVADISPAFSIFERFLIRLEARVSYADELLKNPATFDFTTDEKVLINRKDEQFPADLDAARALWKQRLRLEYLQEKIARLDDNQKSAQSLTNTPDGTRETSPAVGNPSKSDAEQIAEKLSNRYHRNLRGFREWDNDDVMQYYLNALAHVYDPHSDYMPAPAAENFAISMNLQLFGIGAQLSFTDGYCTLEKLFAGGPAAKSAKLKEKERIVGVAQGDGPFVDVVEMNLNKTVRLIRGPKGTTVRLAVIPPVETSPRREITLVRDEIPLEDQAAKGRLIQLTGDDGKPLRLGIVDLPSFYAPFDSSAKSLASQDVEKFLKKFSEEKVDGVILDLRRNGGGSLEEAIKVTGLFIKEGPVVQQLRVRERRPIIHEDVDGRVAYDGPLVVMTSRFSASASEIVAGALQDYGRAVLVGESSTHGKGTVQNLNYLRRWVTPANPTATNDPGEVKMTIAKFYRPGGASTQRKGVLPDIVLPHWRNYSKDIGEDALDTALPWDPIGTTSFTRLDRVDPFLTELARRSNERIAASREFDYMREDIQRYRKRLEDKAISLKEAERIVEKEADEQRDKLRNKERLARPESQARVHEITLKQAVLPGLPPPVEKTNSVAKVPAAATSAHAEAEGEEPPAIDAALEEAENILVDYIRLLAKRGIAVTTPTETK